MRRTTSSVALRVDALAAHGLAHQQVELVDQLAVPVPVDTVADIAPPPEMSCRSEASGARGLGTPPEPIC